MGRAKARPLALTLAFFMTESTKMEIDKNLALTYVRSDIEILAEQWEENEIRAYVNRIRGQIGLLLTTKVISIEEASALEDEMAKSRKTAASNLQKS